MVASEMCLKEKKERRERKILIYSVLNSFVVLLWNKIHSLQKRRQFSHIYSLYVVIHLEISIAQAKI